ncbi:MAG: DMT family transporter [Coriobacteriia bacterium]|nr:DMT family transporter [Coriobacteriia bacterium]
MISAIVPLLVAVAAWAFLGERLSPRAVAGILLSLAGVAILSLGALAKWREESSRPDLAACSSSRPGPGRKTKALPCCSMSR